MRLVALNATMALNIALQGMAVPGCTIVTTAASHNSVLRPLNRLRDESGCTVKVASISPMVALISTNTSACFQKVAFAMLLQPASNLTGDVMTLPVWLRLPISMVPCLFLMPLKLLVLFLCLKKNSAPMWCAFTGHKSLFGPQGTGGLLCSARPRHSPSGGRRVRDHVR